MVVLQDELLQAAPQQVLRTLLPAMKWASREMALPCGGARLASEIRDIVSHHESLESISLVGNSLGVYMRWRCLRVADGNSTQYGWWADPDAAGDNGALHLGVRKYTFSRFLSHCMALVGQSVINRGGFALRDAAEAVTAAPAGAHEVIPFPLLVRRCMPRCRRLCTLLHSIDAFFPMLLRHAPPCS